MTNKFIWDQKYSVGVPMFDEQHQNFFNITNSIIDTVESGNFTPEKTLELLTQLGNYTIYHLNSEEDLFEELGYPDKEGHIQSHKEFREKISQMIEAVRFKKTPTGGELLEIADFAKNWLAQHILVTDAKYTEFFQLNM